MAIPSPTPKPWYVKDVWPAAGALVLGSAASIFALIKELTAEKPNSYQATALLITAVSVIVLGTLKYLQSRYKDDEEDKKKSPHGLTGCLYVIHRIVAGHKQVQTPQDAFLRLTLHRVAGDHLEQLLPYVGGTGGQAGRKFSIHTGLIGRVARAHSPRNVSRPKDMDVNEWRRWLVEETGMTTEQAADTRPDRFDFLGIPIHDPNGRTIAVLYLDSGEPGFFNEDTVALIADGCVGLAKWIDEQYNRK